LIAFIGVPNRCWRLINLACALRKGLVLESNAKV
jgi:hypothetical protein